MLRSPSYDIYIYRSITMHFYNRYNIMLIRLSESWIGLPDSKCNYLEPNMFFVGYQIH